LSKTSAPEHPRLSGFCSTAIDRAAHRRCRGAWPFDPHYPKVPTSCGCTCHAEPSELDELAETLCRAYHPARWEADLGPCAECEAAAPEVAALMAEDE
jgi:hypothetical protein